MPNRALPGMFSNTKSGPGIHWERSPSVTKSQKPSSWKSTNSLIRTCFVSVRSCAFRRAELGRYFPELLRVERSNAPLRSGRSPASSAFGCPRDRGGSLLCDPFLAALEIDLLFCFGCCVLGSLGERGHAHRLEGRNDRMPPRAAFSLRKSRKAPAHRHHINFLEGLEGQKLLPERYWQLGSFYDQVC